MRNRTVLKNRSRIIEFSSLDIFVKLKVKLNEEEIKEEEVD